MANLREYPISFNRMDGGVNYALPQNLIPDNDLAAALNIFYDPITGQPMTRDGVSRYSSTGQGTNPHGLFFSSILDKWLVASGGTLYYLDTSTLAYVSIGALTGSARPHFLDFNSKVLIASGGVIQSTNGTTISNVANAPISYKIMAYGGRVASSGATSAPHRLSLSAPGDETTWSTVAPADGQEFDVDLNVGDGITDFNIYANDIVVFKGPEQRGSYRIIIPVGDYTQAYIKQDSYKSSSINWHTSINENNNLYFLDNNGWKSYKGVLNYGDVEQDPIGAKINGVITPSIDKAQAFMFSNPFYSQVWLKYADVQTIYAFHYLMNGGKGAFLPQEFKDLKVCSACYAEDARYLLMGMSDGYIYKLDRTLYTDNAVAVPGFFLTKRASLKNANITKKLFQTAFAYQGLSNGTVTLEALTDGGTKTATLVSTSISTGSDLLYEATGYLNDATDLLYGETLQSNLSRKMIWHYDLQYRVTVNSGALKLDRLEGLVNIWGRRQV